MSKTEQYSTQELGIGNFNENVIVKTQNSQLKLAEQFSRQAFLAQNIVSLVNLTSEVFVEIFNQRFCLIYKYDKTLQTLHLLNSINSENIPQSIPFNNGLLTENESFWLTQSTTINDTLSGIGFEEAIVGSLYATSGVFNGFIICGHFQENNLNTNTKNPDLLSLFSIMTNVFGLRFENLKANEAIEKERKILAQQLKRSNEDLEQFAYIISHDLKAPLRNIKSFAQLLQKMYRDKLDGDGMTFLDFITGGVSKFDNLINDLLQYSRVSRRAMPFEKTNLNEIIEEVILNTHITVSKDDLEIKSQKLPMISVNADRIEQLFQNLIDNAVKFKQPTVKAKISIKVKKEKDYIQISVADNGIGIEKQYGERIFQLFQKLHADSEYIGTGLGLSICKKIIERHKGKIWMESNGLNKGTTFYVLLPKNLKNL